MNFQKLWKTIINRYSYNFLALIGLEFLISLLFFAVIFCVYTICMHIIPTNILDTTTPYLADISNVSELIDAFFVMIAISLPIISIFDSLLSFLLYGFYLLTKKIKLLKHFDIKNPFKLLLVIYSIILLFLYIIELLLIPIQSMGYGGTDVFIFGQLYFSPIVAITIVIIYFILLLLEINDKFRINREYFKETKYYEFFTIFGFFIILVFIIANIMLYFKL